MVKEYSDGSKSSEIAFRVRNFLYLSIEMFWYEKGIRAFRVVGNDIMKISIAVVLEYI